MKEGLTKKINYSNELVYQLIARLQDMFLILFLDLESSLWMRLGWQTNFHLKYFTTSSSFSDMLTKVCFPRLNGEKC